MGVEQPLVAGDARADGLDQKGSKDERVKERHGESRRDAEQQGPKAEDEQGGWDEVQCGLEHRAETEAA